MTDRELLELAAKADGESAIIEFYAGHENIDCDIIERKI